MDPSAAKTERLLVCVGPSLTSHALIKAVANRASAPGAEWYAVYVETPGMLRLSEAERNRAVYNLRLAEQLGAETLTLRGRSIGEEIAKFARRRNVTKIFAGKPTPRLGWRAILARSPLEELLRLSGDFDVYVISAKPAEPKETMVPAPPKRLRWSGYEGGLLYVILATALCFLMYPYFDLPNLIMVYLLAVMVTAVQCGRGPALLNSLLSVLAFDFCFVPPRWTFTVDEAKYFVTFGVMFLVAVTISHLAALIRRQAEASRLQERQTAAMYAVSRQLASTRGVDKILQTAVNQVSDIFECQAVALLPDEKGKLHPAAGDIPAVFHKDILKELGVAQWAFEAGQMAGWGTQNRPDSPILYVPLPGTTATLGILALRPKDPEAENWLLPEQLRLRLLESLAKQVALALEVESLQKCALVAEVAAETERLRTSLLSTVTHDLQTPLAAIVGSASSLLQGQLAPPVAQEMLTNIYDEGERLSRLINNLLNMAKLESGSLKLHEELQPLEEVVGAALNHLEKQLAERTVQVSLPPDLPMVPLDGALAEQIFINLLENALRYTPGGSPISVSARAQGDHLEVEVADRGLGFSREDLEKSFEMYYRGTQAQESRGYGLGLAICRAVVEAHGGRIWALNQEGGGAAVRFTLPLEPKQD
jgi:two-component system, OmpR family, sensor histidine kinase KdpD